MPGALSLYLWKASQMRAMDNRPNAPCYFWVAGECKCEEDCLAVPLINQTEDDKRSLTPVKHPGLVDPDIRA